MKSIDNLYCAATTPLDSRYEIDYGGLDANIERYIGCGLGGILMCGGTGEFVSLSKQERNMLVEHAAKRIAGRTGLMVGCSAETTADTVNYAKHAECAGADGLLLIASYYFKPSEEELYTHFKTVADSVKIPVVLYNNPGACGTNLSTRLIKRLSTIDNISHIKEAAGDLLQFREIRDACDSDFHMIVGCDSLAYELLKNGAKGWISISANALASQSQTLFNQCTAGEYELAWKTYKQYLPIYTVCESSYKAIQTIKYIMDRLGYCGGVSRLPRQELTNNEKCAVDELLRDSLLI